MADASHPKRELLDREEIRRALLRITHEILERNRGTSTLGILGIRRRGAHLAARIQQEIFVIEKVRVPLGVLDITFYRDDLKTIAHQPVVGTTEIPFDVSDKNLVVVDDVLYTGRTVRAALDEVIDFGRPRSIQLAVLIDRGHRELPIHADYVGKHIPTSQREVIAVQVVEEDGEDRVLLAERPPE
jgi:pyrimidine operon attenuation protein / uracil phosphoribosyltransferase